MAVYLCSPIHNNPKEYRASQFPPIPAIHPVIPVNQGHNDQMAIRKIQTSTREFELFNHNLYI